jgi:hypothetical protein
MVAMGHPVEISLYGGFLGLVISIILVAQKENQNRLNTQMTFVNAISPLR